MNTPQQVDINTLSVSQMKDVLNELVIQIGNLELHKQYVIEQIKAVSKIMSDKKQNELPPVVIHPPNTILNQYPVRNDGAYKRP